MITASLALALALRTALAPLDTAIVASVIATHEAQSVADSQLQPAHFDPARFDSATAIVLRSILDTAAAHRIPTKPLIDQALQGAAYRSSSSKIVNSVRTYYAAMLDAREALGDESTESELASGADAIRAGLDGKALVAIRTTRPAAGSAVTALVIVGDLIKRGISNNKARDAVIALCRSSRSDDPLNGLQHLVAKNAERGPGMAQNAMERYLRANTPGTNASPPPSKPVTRPPGPPDLQ